MSGSTVVSKSGCDLFDSVCADMSEVVTCVVEVGGDVLSVVSESCVEASSVVGCCDEGSVVPCESLECSG